ncbi:MAG: flavodoxin domain-containing protein [Bacteroidales bacterium]|nr:flavodoxin domain-containing protein [Bacteroidales bacterium]
MKTAILYASSHGSTEKVANILQEKIDNAEVFNLKKLKSIDFKQYDQLIIGGSIHAGKIQSKVKSFIEKHKNEILEKKYALYLCCMDRDKEGQQIQDAYPEELRKNAISVSLMGGEFLFEKMNFIERGIIKKISGKKESVHALRADKIEELARIMST